MTPNPVVLSVSMKLNADQRHYVWSLVYCAAVSGDMSRTDFFKGLEACLEDDRGVMRDVNPTFVPPPSLGQGDRPDEKEDGGMQGAPAEGDHLR